MFHAYSLLAVTPVLGLAVYCIAHVLMSRLSLGRGHYYPLVAGCGCGLVATCATSVAALLLMNAGMLDFLAFLSMNTITYLAFSSATSTSST